MANILHVEHSWNDVGEHLNKFLPTIGFKMAQHTGSVTAVGSKFHAFVGILQFTKLVRDYRVRTQISEGCQYWGEFRHRTKKRKGESRSLDRRILLIYLTQHAKL